MPPSAPSHCLSRTPRSALVRIAVVVLLLSVAACAKRVAAPVEERSTRVAPPIGAPAPPSPAAAEAMGRTYTVKRGDTLYAIALDQGLDYRDLAAWNNIENIHKISVGQVLRVTAPGESTQAGVQTMPLRTVPPITPGDSAPSAAAATGAAPAATPSPPGAAPPPASTSGRSNTENYKTQPKAIKEPYSEQAMRDVERAASAQPAAPAPPTEVAPAPVIASVEPKPESKPEPKSEPRPSITADDDVEKLDWVWPAKGKIVAGFSEATSLKGIDIAGTAGQPVVAAAAGKIIYVGTGVRGYGKLIIIKHNGTYLSAYAHNREILVKEDQQVTRGQKIAEMGNTDADQVELHFEIRRNGRPVDPLRYLPPA
jgi:lipoprotein NlpD